MTLRVDATGGGGVSHEGPLPNIHVRVCATHGVELKPRDERSDRLWCPHGRGHYSDTWKVVDTKKGRAHALAGREEGYLRELKERHQPMADKVEPGQKRTLQRAKFTGTAGEVLWIRAVHAPSKLGGDPFRVTWHQVLETGSGSRKVKKNAEGAISTHQDEPAAKARFAEACKEAMKAGWKQAPFIGGRKPIVFKPIPTPGSLRKE